MVWLAAGLPITACLLVLLAVVERAWIRVTGVGPVAWLRKRAGGATLSATAFDEFTSAFHGSKRTELEQRQTELMLRDDETDGAPPDGPIDLDRGVAVIRPSEGSV